MNYWVLEYCTLRVGRTVVLKNTGKFKMSDWLKTRTGEAVFEVLALVLLKVTTRIKNPPCYSFSLWNTVFVEKYYWTRHSTLRLSEGSDCFDRSTRVPSLRKFAMLVVKKDDSQNRVLYSSAVLFASLPHEIIDYSHCGKHRVYKNSKPWAAYSVLYSY
jgi:hypothetical protein